MEEKEKKQEWQRMDDLKSFVIQLKQKYHSQLSHIEPEMMLYAAFSKKRSSVAANIRAITGVWSLFKNECYILAVHLETWDMLADPERFYTIYHELLHIPEEGFIEGEKEFKKLNKHDLQDFKSLVDEFGVYKENIEKIVKNKDEDEE